LNDASQQCSYICCFVVARVRNPILAALKKVGVGMAVLPACVLALPPRAEAILRYYIHDADGAGRIDALGTLNLPTPLETPTGISAFCPSNSPYVPPAGNPGIQTKAALSALNICTGPSADNSVSFKGYAIEVVSQGFTTDIFAAASSYYGPATGLIGETPAFYVQSSYSGGSIASGALLSGTLASVGITGSGLIAQYNILDGRTVTDSIEVYLDSPPRPVPGPLPIVGASLAFAWSRKLRQRVGLMR
jgi:hypothetical protein